MAAVVFVDVDVIAFVVVVWKQMVHQEDQEKLGFERLRN